MNNIYAAPEMFVKHITTNPTKATVLTYIVQVAPVTRTAL